MTKIKRYKRGRGVWERRGESRRIEKKIIRRKSGRRCSTCTNMVCRCGGEHVLFCVVQNGVTIALCSSREMAG
jgi:hypothetical protein